MRLMLLRVTLDHEITLPLQLKLELTHELKLKLTHELEAKAVSQSGAGSGLGAALGVEDETEGHCTRSS